MYILANLTQIAMSSSTRIHAHVHAHAHAHTHTHTRTHTHTYTHTNTHTHAHVHILHSIKRATKNQTHREETRLYVILGSFDLLGSFD